MKKSFLMISFILILNTLLHAGKISEYKVQNYCIEYENQEFSVIRSFKEDGLDRILVVHSDTMQTYIFDKNHFKKVECSNSIYKKILENSVKPPYPLVNDGISNFVCGTFLTVDFCPSSKNGYERRFFKYLISKFENPVPVTIFITKRWIKSHYKEFCELKRWDKDRKLAITWGNHTAYHFYKKGLPIKQNFVLAKHKHLKDDILELEICLIQNGVVPSVFFRFPGLVSNQEAINTIKKLSLITIGSDCWLAKQQLPKEGSIILVHGNKNEPLGIKLLTKHLRQNIKELLSLSDGIVYYQSKNKNSADKK